MIMFVFLFSSFLPNLFAAPAKLSDAGLYFDIASKSVSPLNQSYAPIYPLWSDGAEKKRWIWLPIGQKIDSDNMDTWIFPVGTKIWKEFSFPDVNGKWQRVESRLIEKIAPDKWDYATYVWDAGETEAALAPKEGIRDHFPIAEGKRHDIPSISDCRSCHAKGMSPGDEVLGFSSLQLSSNRDPLAPHAESKPVGGIDLDDLIRDGRLTRIPKFPPSIRDPNEVPLQRPALGYLHANCASCHNPGRNVSGGSAARWLYLNHHNETIWWPEETAFMATVNVLAKSFEIPGLGPRQTFRIRPGDPDKSAILFRMSRMEPEHHMPPLGTKLVDQQAVDLIKRYILLLGILVSAE